MSNKLDRQMIDKNATDVTHCVAKMAELLDDLEIADLQPRDIYQLGYNAGRLGELTGMGRQVWDRTKEAVQLGKKEEIIDLLQVINSYLPGYDWEAEKDRADFASSRR